MLAKSPVPAYAGRLPFEFTGCKLQVCVKRKSVATFGGTARTSTRLEGVGIGHILGPNEQVLFTSDYK